MKRYHEEPWFRHGLLLSALAIGGLMTFFVPTYQEMAAAREQSIREATAPEPRENTSRGITEADVDQRHLQYARSAS